VTVARITLAIGAEPILVERAVLGVSAAARAADPTVQRSVIEAGDDAAVLQFREATAPNLFGDGGVVVVTGVDAADDRLAAAIREVIADLPDNVFLVFTHPGGVKGKALLDALKSAGADVVDCQAVKRGKATVEFLTREFASHRRKATAPAIIALYESVGQDLGLLSAGVSQLVADIDANPIDVDDVRAYFAGVADVAGFTIADAVWERRYADALRSLRLSMLSSDAGRVGPVTVTALAMGLRTLVRVGGMPPGTSAAVVAKEAGAPPWKVESLRRQWAKWSGDQRRLAVAVVALADADGAVKGGVLEGSSLVDEQKLLALEILVAATAGTSTSEG
jgi:DNA polymerase-3 subunit delta